MQSEEQELGHYQLRRLLGEGGFGEVYEAWDSKLQRSIAIKRLKPKLLSSRPENLLDEARMAASLRHPAFVKIFSIDGDADQQSIIMEYVDGSTLRKMGEGEPLSEPVALDIVAQVAEAMEEAHASKLIHGDLKPSNLMLEASGTVRIMDFGLARRIDPQSTESVVLDDAQGTIAYLAPELLTGTRPNEQSDVYSLGVVLYEMVTGGRPFPHLNGLALAAAHMQSSSSVWPFPPQVNPAVSALVRSMTQRDLAGRLGSMYAVRNAIVAIKEKHPIARRAIPFAPGKLMKWLRAFPKWKIGLAAGLAFSIGLGVTQFDRILELNPAGTLFFSESAAMKAGHAALRLHDREENVDTAVKSFTSVLERNPEHAAAAAGLARAYSMRYAGNRSDAAWLQRAAASAQLALRLNDQLALAHVAQGEVFLLQGNLDEALKVVNKSLRLDPLDAFAPILKVNILIQLNDLDKAEEVVTDGMRQHPRDHNYFDALGTIKYRRGDYAGAAPVFARSIALQRDGVTAYANLSAAYLRLNRIDEALSILQQGLQVRAHWRLYQNLGTVLFDRGEYVESAKAFERGVSGGGETRYLNWANLADTLRWIPGRSGESHHAYKQAVARLRPALIQSPANATMNSRFGLYLARLGDTTEGVKATLIALSTSPKNAEVHFRAAIVYELAGQRDVALAELSNAQQLKYPLNLISSEPDLIALRRDPRFTHPLPESP